jgi:hypothetical protein
MVFDKQDLYATVKWLSIFIIIAFIVLAVLEVRSDAFPVGSSGTTAELAKQQNKHLPQKGVAESYFDVPIEEEGTIFKGLPDYLVKIEEGKLYNEADLGCYDNDDIISEIKGTGQTCKTWAPKVTDIYYKRAPDATVPTTVEAGLNNYFVAGNGQEYSFAEICPETTNQDRPVACVYKKGEKFAKLSDRLGNIIDIVQERQNNRLSNLDSSIRIHTVDSNRLYTKPFVADFLKYENTLGMNTGQPDDSGPFAKLADLDLYGQVRKGQLGNV